ncbi:MAG: glutamate--cysteine ligase [Pseudomonadota bacterium]
MARDTVDDTPIESRDQLIATLESGSKPPEDWRIGTEHEKFGFYTKDLSPVPYEGDTGIGGLLKGMETLLGWEPIVDDGRIIGLYDPTGGGAISLEPGGQFELSGAPLENLHQTCREAHAHLAQLREVAEPLGIGFLGVGASPKWRFDETPKMPKSRYDIMRAYMPKVGGKGLDMMHRTSTIQVNLDFRDEADMRKKMRVSLALQPIATAVFANSPFLDGKPNGFQSYRSEVWRDTDPDRTGMLPFAFDDGFGFEAYVDWMLDVPMYFIKRDQGYLDVSGLSFRDFLEGRLSEQLPGETATIGDWKNHISTAFPEVRLKNFLEMRGADGGPWRRICALPAFWVGILYDDASLEAAWDLVKDWSADERQILRDTVPVSALKTRIRNRTVQEVARDVVEISREGLKNRQHLNADGDDETLFLAPVEETVMMAKTPADQMLDDYHGPWNQKIDPIFEHYAY